MQLGSLQEVIDRYIHDGQSVALEGFTHLIPFAAGHEILRQKKRDLHLIRMTPDLIYDQLIGAGCARALTFSWGGNPGVGSLHRLRDAVENDWPRPLTIHEHSHAGMAAAYTAGAARLPFGMLRGYVGTDLSGVNAQIREVTLPVYKRDDRDGARDQSRCYRLARPSRRSPGQHSHSRHCWRPERGGLGGNHAHRHG